MHARNAAMQIRNPPRCEMCVLARLLDMRGQNERALRLAKINHDPQSTKTGAKTSRMLRSLRALRL